MLDMMGALSILSIVLAIAVPQMSQLTPSFNKSNAQAYLMYDLRRAHAETVTEGCRGIFTLDADGRGYSFGCDYIPYSVLATPVPDTTIFTRDLPASIIITATGQLLFNSKGQAIDASDTLVTTTIYLWADGTAGSPTNQFASGNLMPTGMFIYN